MLFDVDNSHMVPDKLSKKSFTVQKLYGGASDLSRESF